MLMNESRHIIKKGMLVSFKAAFRGLWIMLISQRHARAHLAATVAVCAAGAYYAVSKHDWCWLVIAVISVWTAEALNTAFEFLCDVASPDFHPLVENAKDVAACAVLICAVGAAVIGVVIFWPYVTL